MLPFQNHLIFWGLNISFFGQNLIIVKYTKYCYIQKHELDLKKTDRKRKVRELIPLQKINKGFA